MIYGSLYGLSAKIFPEIEKRFLTQSSVKELYFCFYSSDCSSKRSLMAFLKIFFWIFQNRVLPYKSSEAPIFLLDYDSYGYESSDEPLRGKTVL